MENEINKILIKTPKLSENAFSVFPFLIQLSEIYPKAEINIIVEFGDMLAFNFLPFKVKVFERPSKKQNLLETHQYVANLHEVFNIDIFFDLENSFNSAFLGFNFRAKIRVGYEEGWNKHLLTHRFVKKSDYLELNGMNLLEQYLERNFSDIKISNEINSIRNKSKTDKLFNEPEQPKFILIMLDNFSGVTRDIDMWKNFFDSFDKQKFIVWSKDDEDIISEILSKIDIRENELFMHRGSFPNELKQVMGRVTGIIVNNFWAEGLCAFYNLDILTFVMQESILPNYRYFKFRPKRVHLNEYNQPELKSVDSDSDRKFEDFNELIDFIHMDFKL